MDHRDSIQAQLDAVTTQLARPAFLQNLTPSRLPSQATSEASVSPRPPSSNDCRSLLTLEHGACLTAHPHHHNYHHDNPAYLELRASEAHARRAWSTMAASAAFQPFDHAHSDLVLAVDFNFFGTRMVTASSDHRLKVWDRKDDAWSLVDTWRAHDAEVVDVKPRCPCHVAREFRVASFFSLTTRGQVKWNGPFMGEVLGSIGEDGRFKLWQEDVTEIANSGRRFKLIYNQVSETKVPFMSLDFKNIMQETWVALISRDGYLTIYEPIDHSNLSEWQVMAQTFVLPTAPPRSDEASFRVCFHHEQLPCWTAIQAGLDRRALSLAVVAMDTVKVYRTDKQRRFYVAAELTGSRNILRDVAWANGSMRGSDIIATASKDGMLRIYDLSTPEPSFPLGGGASGPGGPGTPSTGGGLAAPSVPPEPAASPRGRGASRNAPSGIGAGLASATRVGDAALENDQDPGRVKHVVKLAAELQSNHGAVWRVTFSQMGDLLVSTGDDGAIRTWKKASDNRWLEYAEIDATKQ
ncbi:uncharacterized protein K452DRAFT_309219 [Aplosporella prunicola CBS 121167]|uniref:Uncharacterized protein n=1 Tax=Aplosporella prunicola CBS 121167 TaxID=1176127 RepID=A0A6A6BEZ4_9PEZI|nr:uncharacterized protein K452DRAFT_309219 [Aplosporella prunicola CBS 121167]KAF2141467.1 hypothetical protein K452DRAFT_309219 [Aplosporella prunicola CBS 121167]